MPASWKYFAFRTVNVVIVLIIVTFILSAAFSTMAEEELEVTARNQAAADLQARDTWGEDEDPAEYYENQVERYRERYNLDQPRWRRIFDSAVDVLVLDFGRAQEMEEGGSSQVTDIIMTYLPRTILLFTTAAAIYTALGILVGLKAAQVAGSKMDKALSLFGITATSLPMWWIGMVLIVIFVHGQGWFPRPSPRFPDYGEMGLWSYLFSFDRHDPGILFKMLLPLTAIIINLFGGRAWVTRNLVTGILQDDYIMAARAKGVPERKVIYGHTLKTAAPPVVTSAILALLMSMAGALISEIIFAWPGMGYLLRTAIFTYTDVPVIIGVAFVTAFLYIFGYYIADILYGFLDPRVEVGTSKQMGGR